MLSRTCIAISALAFGALTAPAQAAERAAPEAITLFARGCLDNQPGFEGTSADMARLGGKQAGESWAFANGMFASVVRKADGVGCLVSVPGGSGPVVAAISEELNRTFGGYELVAGANGQPAAIVETASGKLAIIIVPDRQRNLTTLIAQPAPKRGIE